MFVLMLLLLLLFTEENSRDSQRLLVQSMLDEYDEVSVDEATQSKWVQQLLFRHLQKLLQHEVC